MNKEEELKEIMAELSADAKNMLLEFAKVLQKTDSARKESAT